MENVMTVNNWIKGKLFSSDKMDWETPDSLFHVLNEEFQFTLDAAATATNAKCANYLTVADNALTCDWASHSLNGSIWLNPPYGRGIGDWIQKAYTESQKGVTVVVLSFARTDTKWWHSWAMKAPEIRLIPGRITFKEAPGAAPAPSCLLIFDESLRSPSFVVQKLPRK